MYRMRGRVSAAGWLAQIGTLVLIANLSVNDDGSFSSDLEVIAKHVRSELRTDVSSSPGSN